MPIINELFEKDVKILVIIYYSDIAKNVSIYSDINKFKICPFNDFYAIIKNYL